MARGLEAQLAAFENASDDDDSSDGGGDSVDHDELARAGEAASSDDDESDGEADASDDEGYDSEAEAGGGGSQAQGLGPGQLKAKKGRKDAGLKAEVDDAVRKRKQRKHDERKRDVVRSMKREERTKVKAGKQPYCEEVRRQAAALEDRFDQLKKAGKLNGFLRKKARKPTSLLEAGASLGARRRQEQGACMAWAWTNSYFEDEGKSDDDDGGDDARRRASSQR
ncbi:hypothetical protein JL720_11305 [Aureococcus anophagefferens]|nr:hypothetical protein JL720_11305 [Aureococcus anophagefferens]